MTSSPPVVIGWRLGASVRPPVAVRDRRPCGAGLTHRVPRRVEGRYVKTVRRRHCPTTSKYVTGSNGVMPTGSADPPPTMATLKCAPPQ